MNLNEILDTVVRSRALAGKASSVKLLRFLAEHSYPHNDPAARTADQVANWLECEPGTVCKYCQRLHKALDQYYESEGKHDRYRLTLGSGGRQGALSGTNWLVSAEWKGERPTRRFWAPHFALQSPVELITNSPLFYRHRSGSYRVRVMGVNDQSSLEVHQHKNEPPHLNEFEQCFHYVSIGDFRLSAALVKFFTKQNITLKTKIVYSSKDLEDPYILPDDVNLKDCANLIALGNRRVSWVVRALCDKIKPNFAIPEGDQRGFRNGSPRLKEKPYYEDDLSPDGSLHAAIIRRSDKSRCQTIVCVQNGPALEALSTSLTEDDSCYDLLAKAGWGNSPIPPSFELLFRVSLGSKEIVQRDEAPTLLAARP